MTVMISSSKGEFGSTVRILNSYLHTKVFQNAQLKLFICKGSLTFNIQKTQNSCSEGQDNIAKTALSQGLGIVELVVRKY